MQDKKDILGVKVNNINIEEALHYAEELIKTQDYGKLIVTPNPEIIVMSLADNHFKEIINNADLALPDGIGVVLASRILNKKIQKRAAGFDFMKKLLKRTAEENHSIYLLGAEPEIIEKARRNIADEYHGISIAGYHHGYLDKSSSRNVVEEINNLKPDILLVGMGIPRQEKFLDKFLPEMKVKLAVTVGGSFDVLAGKVRRAPYWMQKVHLEWFYRLLQEPQRLKRMTALPYFVYLVLKEKARGFWNAD